MAATGRELVDVAVRIGGPGFVVITGETTSNCDLVITPELGADGFGAGFTVTHQPSGRAVFPRLGSTSDLERTREFAEDIARHDWSFASCAEHLTTDAGRKLQVEVESARRRVRTTPSRGTTRAQIDPDPPGELSNGSNTSSVRAMEPRQVVGLARDERDDDVVAVDPAHQWLMARDDRDDAEQRDQHAQRRWGRYLTDARAVNFDAVEDLVGDYARDGGFGALQPALWLDRDPATGRPVGGHITVEVNTLALGAGSARVLRLAGAWEPLSTWSDTERRVGGVAALVVMLNVVADQARRTVASTLEAIEVMRG